MDTCNMNMPFGNSVFQIQTFTDGKETPQRRCRHCLLQLRQKEQTMKECWFRQRRAEIDINEIKEKIQSAQGYEEQRLQIDLEEKQYQLDSETKLIEDCVVEIATYRKILEQLPKYTREEFEAAEPEYWGKRIIGDARREVVSSGCLSPQTIESLENLGFKISRNKEGCLVYTKENNNDISHLGEAGSLGNETDNSQTNAS